MGKTSKEIKTAVFSNPGQAISRRILVADDDRPVLNVVSRFLKFLGFEVALAGNGLEALAIFIKGSYDLVLTDLQMPAMDGLSLARHIKGISPGTPIILLTGSDRETVRKKVEKGTVDSVMYKPFRLNDLKATVQGALELRK